TFNLNGHGSDFTKVVVKGEAVAEPAAPTAAGFTFQGWFTEVACINAYNFDTPVNNDFTLYAKWTKNSGGGGIPVVTYYEINVDETVGGNVVPKVPTATAGTNVVITVIPAKGYAFGGWDPSTTVTIEYSEGVYSFTMPASNVFIKAIFDEVPVVVVDSISVKTAPTKVTYKEGEYFIPVGLVITAKLEDGTTMDIPYAGNEGAFTFVPAVNVQLTPSDSRVVIVYSGCSTTQAITVKSGTPVIESIAVKTAPAKTTYNVGDRFDPAGLVITVTYSDASTKDVPYEGNESAFRFSPSGLLKESDRTVTITYADKTATQDISVSTVSSDGDFMIVAVISIIAAVIAVAAVVLVIRNGKN
ncbi:MAG: InlB B-repeat-containing protein, partial [Candidatus Methanomethylophilaceae archaeon]|nr:InlB B-repeat-containing protein [Candidatus Methanomethylophilaceae archaeon]